MPLVLLWIMDVMLGKHEIVLNHAEIVLVESIDFDEKHPFSWSNFEKRYCFGKLSSNSIKPCIGVIVFFIGFCLKSQYFAMLYLHCLSE